MEPIAGVAAARALGWALVHFLWQGCAIAGALALVRVALPERAARVRYVAGCVALLALLAAPAITFGLLHGGAGVDGAGAASAAGAPGDAAGASGDAAADVSAGSEAIAIGPGGAQASGSAAATTATSADGAAAREVAPRWIAAARAWLEPAIPSVLAVWLVGVFLLSLRLTGGWVAARRVAVSGCEAAEPRWLATVARMREALGVSRPVRLAASIAAEVPSVVGWLRPVVVVPVSVFAGMTPWQIEAILGHELAHIRRHDYLVNLIQSAVETLLFYHPATWWVSRQVREERERCCDDVAVGLCGDPAGYVGALAQLEAMRAAPALAMSATGGSLLGRARRLLAPTDARRSSGTVAAAVALGVLACLWASARAEVPRDAGGPVAALEIAPPAPSMAGIGFAAPLAWQAVPGVPAEPTALPEPPLPAEPTALPEPPLPAGPPLLAEPAAPDLPPVLAPSTPRMPELLYRLGPPPAAPRTLGGPPRAAPPRRDPPGRAAADGGGREGPDLIDVMAELGYRHIPVQQLISLGIHGVKRDDVRGLNGLGLGRLDVEMLIDLKIHGVTPEYARELRAAGVAIARPQELQAMKIHGVTPAFVREVKRLGLGPLSPERLVSLRISGVILERRSR